MKNLIKWFGIIALAAVIGFSMAACGDDDDTSTADPFKGTWISDEEDANVWFTAADGKFTLYEKHDIKNEEESWEMAFMRGTYTVSGNAVSGVFTDVNKREEKTDPDQWVAYAGLSTEEKGDSLSSFQGTVSGNTVAITFSAGEETVTMEFTKQ
jgi:uncharacterized lipoprotein YehR (DUF1307 family)